MKPEVLLDQCLHLTKWSVSQSFYVSGVFVLLLFVLKLKCVAYYTTTNCKKL